MGLKAFIPTNKKGGQKKKVVSKKQQTKLDERKEERKDREGGREKDGQPNKKQKVDGDSDLELEGTATAEDIADSVTKELTQIREIPELAPEEEPDSEEDIVLEQEDEKPEEGAKADPYLLADAAYIQKDTRWRNKQRTLVFASRGVQSRFRHLCEDFKKLIPHHKPEPKFEKKGNLQDINEICEMKSCNNVIYFEARKGKDLYMYVARVPTGPTIKFQVHNVHTTAEVRLAGNCLLGSRPIFYFDHHFSKISYLMLIKDMLTQAMGTPRNHPKSKPFHDHVMGFYFMDRKIWFRHYQIAPEAPDAMDNPERQVLTEIGPRFVMEPMRILSGSFSGNTIYLNPFYWSPTKLRVYAKRLKKSPVVEKMKEKESRQKREKEQAQPEDPTDDVFK